VVGTARATHQSVRISNPSSLNELHKRYHLPRIPNQPISQLIFRRLIEFQHPFLLLSSIKASSEAICIIAKNIFHSQLVGLEPARPDRLALSEDTAQQAQAQQPFLRDIQSLLTQYLKICNLLKIIVHKEEHAIAVTCLTAIYNNILLIQTQLSWRQRFEAGGATESHSLVLLTTLHTKLWYQLAYPHITEVRKTTHDLIIQLENIIHLYFPSLQLYKFTSPDKVSQPSFYDQIIHSPVTIIDPYILALRNNYYFPLTSTEVDEEKMPEDTPMNNTSPSQSPQRTAPSTVPITVESSIQAITDIIKEVEADDPPTEAASVPLTLEAEKQSVFTHRFAIYRKNTYPTPGAPPNQLVLFKSFVKSVKVADHSSKILPIRSDVKIYPLSTTDQINSLEHIGIMNYFKPYKKTQKTLSGDFCISTKWSFEELKEHPAFNTWLMHQGYNVNYNACQTADMVKIGFLSRIRGFTYRGDLQEFIMGSAEWKANPFYFRFYFDAFTVRGKTAHVLMVDVDRPNIELGIRFFQQWYNGSLTNTPNELPYMFWPLYKKTYSEEERMKIINDNAHHIGADNVIGITGLQPIDSLVQLVNGTYTTIRKLLLSIPAPGTVTGQLFLQVERQSANDWLLCCFHQQDASKVTLRLGTLEESLRKCTHATSIPKLFTSPNGLTITNQVGQLSKSKNRLPRLEVPTYTADYVSQSLQRLYTPTAKRQATELNAGTTSPEVQTIPVPRAVPTTYVSAATPVTPNVTTQTETQHNQESLMVQELRSTTTEHSATLEELRKCCVSLSHSQKQLSESVATMNEDINRKFSDLVDANRHLNDRFKHMSLAIESLQPSTTSRPAKLHKDNHGLPDVSFHG